MEKLGTTEEVVIVGAGPTGLWLACELALAGADPLVLEREHERSPHSKALGLHARSIEVLAMRGLAEEFLASGVKVPSWHFGMLRSRLDFRSLRTAFPFMLAIPQVRSEELIEKRALELGVRIRRGVAVSGLNQDTDAVTLRIAGGDEVRAAFVVGCDGAGSAVRKATGIAFPGTTSPAYGFLGDVTLAEPPAPGFSVHNERGALIVAPMPDGRFRVTGYDPQDHDSGEQTFAALRDSTLRMAGTDFGMRDPIWLSRFGLAARQVERYRDGRVLLAGDAAHIHPPAGGVGLNAGLQDAMNLGWKLAMVVQGKAPVALLDSYHDERHPIGTALLSATQAQSALIRETSPDGQALRAELETLIATIPEVALRLADKLTALDVGYPPADPFAHPIVGARVADPAVFERLHSGAPVVVDSLDEPGWAGITAAIVRPDGHVWWATGTPSGPDLDLEIKAAQARWPLPLH